MYYLIFIKLVKLGYVTISVRLGKELEDRLEKISKLTGRTKSYYIKEALEEKLDDLEDVYTAEKRLENSFNEGKYTLEEVS